MQKLSKSIPGWPNQSVQVCGPTPPLVRREEHSSPLQYSGTDEVSIRLDDGHALPVTAEEYPETVQECPRGANRPPVRVNANELEADDVVIAVMGPTGSGKSSFICRASGYDTRIIGHGMKSFTNEVVAIRFWDKSGRKIVLVDTPGFDAAHKSDLDILTMISDWLNSSYDTNRLLSGILYLHRITDNRMSSTPLKNLRMFRELCGNDALTKIYLTTTMWDEVDPKAGEGRLDELRTDYWKEMITHGAHVARCQSDNGSAKELIRNILAQESLCKLWSPDHATVDHLTEPHLSPTPAQKRVRAEINSIETGSRSGEKSLTGQELPQIVKNPPARVNIKDLGADDIVIAVMGPTGSGKSTFICRASGYHETGIVGHKLKSFTSEVVVIRFWDQSRKRYVVLVDTPGFDATDKSDLHTLIMISNWLNASYKEKKLLSGILYLHRITDNRMANKPLKNLQLFHKLCGNDALAKVYLTTTMWDEVDPMVGERRLDELKTDYWKEMINHGAQIACCRSDDGSAKQLIQRILAQEGKCEVQLQKEMVDRGMELSETAAGKWAVTGRRPFSPLKVPIERVAGFLRRFEKEKKTSSQPTALAVPEAESNDSQAGLDTFPRLKQFLHLPRRQG